MDAFTRARHVAVLLLSSLLCCFPSAEPSWQSKQIRYLLQVDAETTPTKATVTSAVGFISALLDSSVETIYINRSLVLNGLKASDQIARALRGVDGAITLYRSVTVVGLGAQLFNPDLGMPIYVLDLGNAARIVRLPSGVTLEFRGLRVRGVYNNAINLNEFPVFLTLDSKGSLHFNSVQLQRTACAMRDFVGTFQQPNDLLTAPVSQNGTDDIFSISSTNQAPEGQQYPTTPLGLPDIPEAFEASPPDGNHNGGDENGSNQVEGFDVGSENCLLLHTWDVNDLILDGCYELPLKLLNVSYSVSSPGLPKSDVVSAAAPETSPSSAPLGSASLAGTIIKGTNDGWLRKGGVGLSFNNTILLCDVFVNVTCEKMLQDQLEQCIWELLNKKYARPPPPQPLPPPQPSPLQPLPPPQPSPPQPLPPPQPSPPQPSPPLPSLPLLPSPPLPLPLLPSPLAPVASWPSPEPMPAVAMALFLPSEKSYAPLLVVLLPSLFGGLFAIAVVLGGIQWWRRRQRLSTAATAAAADGKLDPHGDTHHVALQLSGDDDESGKGGSGGKAGGKVSASNSTRNSGGGGGGGRGNLRRDTTSSTTTTTPMTTITIPASAAGNQSCSAAASSALSSALTGLTTSTSAGPTSTATGSPNDSGSTDPTRTIQLHRMLGMGSFGRVYYGTWNGQSVAIKIIPHSDSANLKVQQEVALVTRFNHPNVVRALHYATFDGAALEHHHMAQLESMRNSTTASGTSSLSMETWIVLEYCDAGSLATHLASRANVLAAAVEGSTTGTIAGSAAAAAVVAALCGCSAEEFGGGGGGLTGGVGVGGGLLATPVGSLLQRSDGVGGKQQDQRTTPITTMTTAAGAGAGKYSLLAHMSGVLSVARDIATGMAYLHSLNVCHGDLKCENVLLSTRQLGEAGAAAAAATGAAVGVSGCGIGSTSPANAAEVLATTTKTTTTTTTIGVADQSERPLSNTDSGGGDGGDVKVPITATSKPLALADTGSSSPSSGTKPSHGSEVEEATATVRAAAASRCKFVMPYEAKVADFGLSKAFSEVSTHISTATVGTVTHMCPVLLQTGQMRPSCDVFSFGIVLWQLVTGGTPFVGMRYAEIVYKVAVAGLRPEFPPHTPRRLVAVAEACWAADPNTRPTFEQLVTQLGELMEAADELQAEQDAAILAARAGVVRMEQVTFAAYSSEDVVVANQWAAAAAAALLE